MKQSLKIQIFGQIPHQDFSKFVQKNAQKLGIEGTIQNLNDQTILIQATGISQHLDELIDSFYKNNVKAKITDIEVEPLIQERDFRGVFRIIGE